MAPKRKRQTTLQANGLRSGEILQRDKLARRDYASWSWVGTEVADASEITNAHRLAAYGFSAAGDRTACLNKYSERSCTLQNSPENAIETESDEVTIVSDNETSSVACEKRTCKGNPYCLNYLGQDRWEKAETAKRAFMKSVDLGDDPSTNARHPELPVGLQNLGATCYANASLQVWYQDIAFRNGVYRCQVDDPESPIFQLQVVFAALQKSVEGTFNPVKLVESLKLRASEQQDAQEFSKLFLSHLDAEFQKQKSPNIAHLIPRQFQGQQVYGTLCHGCGKASERASDFLELELNLEPHCRLEDRVEALLAEETLSGNNQYYCSYCDKLRDATRYFELRQLPPVLHISLMRFVFDFENLERKKSKNAVSFPTTIDMSQFVRSRQAGGAHCSAPQQLYQLHGVLLHKGASAYHGHYEAQVLSVEDGAWYQFNDEVVTKLKMPILNGMTQANGSLTENNQVDSTDSVPQNGMSNGLPNRMTSKEAYMLVYVRVTPEQDGSLTSAVAEPPENPPPTAMLEVGRLNEAYLKTCEEYKAKELAVVSRFHDLKHVTRTIYQQWDTTDGEETAVLSRQALEKWLTGPLASSRKRNASTPPAGDLADRNDPPENPTNDLPVASPNAGGAAMEDKTISVADVICDHGKLDPRKVNDIKCIRKSAYVAMVEKTEATFEPAPLSERDTCDVCVAEIFQERLYGAQHSMRMSQFDAVCDEDLDTVEAGYWVSKAWIKDWKLAKPKMVSGSFERLHPDHPAHGESVVCEHGGLTPQSTKRRRISAQAVGVLQVEFPEWQPLPADIDPCAVCLGEADISKAGKRDSRRAAEEEKFRLKHAYEQTLSTVIASAPEDVPCAMIPATFLQGWKQWLTRPAGSNRPIAIDTAAFLCNHGQLVLDPNVLSDVEGVVAFVPTDEWRIFEELYSTGPLLAATLTKVADEQGVPHPRWVLDTPVCDECRKQSKSEYESTEVTVLVKSARVTKAAPSKSAGPRQSRRLRDVKTHGVRRRFPVTKQTSVKDLKVAIQHELKIPTIAQRLSFRGAQLDENGATMAELGVLVNDLFELQELSEDYDVLEMTDGEDAPAAKRRCREEGAAFNGTLLGGPSLPSLEPPPSVRPCGVCTYDNAPENDACAMCDTLL